MHGELCVKMEFTYQIKRRGETNDSTVLLDGHRNDR